VNDRWAGPIAICSVLSSARRKLRHFEAFRHKQGSYLARHFDLRHNLYMLASLTEARTNSRVLEVLADIKAFGISLRHEDAVANYLAKNEEVLEAIHPVAHALWNRFSNQCVITLEFFASHSSPDRYPVFFLRQAAYEKTFMLEVRRLLDEVEHLFSFKSGWLAVTTDFQSA
jgi:hypothetical protein